MVEYIVECDLMPIEVDGQELYLVAPHTPATHIHERLIRCRDCGRCKKVILPPDEVRYECRRYFYSRHYTKPDGFCSDAEPRGTIPNAGDT